MRQRAKRQRKLFDDEVFFPPPLQEDVQQEAMRLLVQWMAALAKAIGKEVDDEPHHR